MVSIRVPSFSWFAEAPKGGMLVCKLSLIAPRIRIEFPGIPSAEPPCLRERMCVYVCVWEYLCVCECVCIAHTQALGVANQPLGLARAHSFEHRLSIWGMKLASLHLGGPIYTQGRGGELNRNAPLLGWGGTLQLPCKAHLAPSR